jgi:hypothetical protein
MLELDVKGSKSYQELKSIVLSNTFPWHIDQYGSNDKKSNFEFLSHSVVRRGDTKPNSFIYDLTLKFLQSCGLKYRFKIKQIYRMAFNLTYPCSFEKSGIHTDLSFDHKNIIIYLKNDEYELGTIIYNKMLESNTNYTYKNYTYIDDKDLDILKETKGKEDTGIMFDGLHYHEAYFPKKDKRISLVVNI